MQAEEFAQGGTHCQTTVLSQAPVEPHTVLSGDG